MAKMSVTLVAAVTVLTALLGAATPAPLAGASPVASRVGPDQAFAGLVNGATEAATVEVLCPGPIRINQTGHPVAGQTVAVSSLSAVSTVTGFTGSKAHSIAATLLAPASTAAGLNLVFTRYGSKALPTTILLPCTGTTVAVFSPRPSSPTGAFGAGEGHLRSDLRSHRLPRRPALTPPGRHRSPPSGAPRLTRDGGPHSTGRRGAVDIRGTPGPRGLGAHRGLGLLLVRRSGHRGASTVGLRLDDAHAHGRGLGGPRHRDRGR